MRQQGLVVDRGASRSLVDRAAIPDTVQVDALCDIAAGLARVERRVPESSHAGHEMPRSTRLIATVGYDVWLITWPPGSEIGQHDHGSATSVVRVVTGSLTEWRGATGQAVLPGSSIVVLPFTRHRLLNATGDETTSLHVYSPPLSAVTYHDSNSSHLLHPAGTSARTWPIRSRRAEASSAPSDFPAGGSDR